MGGFPASILHFLKNALHYRCIIFASELHQMSIMSTCMIVIVCVVYDSKIMAKLMKMPESNLQILQIQEVKVRGL